ncbi:MAG TPA: BTAD domain-containing putative transcriptional regulator [Acidimicrobiales bacterium]|nr:BTAD domain-containing putative transcriptional regulator [Acidimicrobiales bacterium]
MERGTAREGEVIGVGLLGPVTVRCDGADVELAGTRERALLARLALDPGRPLSRDRLVDDLWGEALPRNPSGSLQTLVYRLRRSLGSAGQALTWSDGGYTLALADDDVDATRFTHLVAAARRARRAGDDEEARTLLREALALWRGTALAGLDVPFAGAQRARLEAAHRDALGERIEADLACGESTALVAELQGLVGEHPLEERFWGQLMLAQYRAGSQAAALRTYTTLRRRLADELGVEPEPQIRVLERAILAHDPLLDVEPTSPPPPADRDGPASVLMTDVASKAGPWERRPRAFTDELSRVDTIVARVVRHHGGQPCGGWDGRSCNLFDRPCDAAAAALAVQGALGAQRSVPKSATAVVVALHVGDVHVRAGTAFGEVLHEAGALARAGHGGQIVVSETAAALVRDGLPSECELLDLGHWRLPDLAPLAHVSELRHRDLGPAFMSLRVGRPGSGSLPVPANAFVGRSAELSAIAGLVADRSVVTLTGVGGVGKTRLALEAARRVRTPPGGAWFCDLSSAHHAHEVVEAVAAALSLQAASVEELRRLVADWLVFTPALLVLDNCEHLALAVCALLEEVVRAQPAATILATSRCALGVPGERVVRVDPFGPSSGEGDGPDPGTALLIDRARAAGAPVDDDADPGLRAIVDCVDGLPLAIELAARRLAAMTASDLAERLARSIDLLAVPLPGEHRHSTLTSTIDWSFEQLAPPTQALFGALSMLSGPWTLDAAEAIGMSVSLSPAETSRIVADLWDQSLVTTAGTQPGRARYQMLATVRMYAARKLEDGGDPVAVAACHATHFVRLAHAQALSPYGPGEAAALTDFDEQFDNVRRAFRWCVDTRHWDLGAVLLRAVVDELVVRERIEVGRWAAEALAALGHEEHPLKAAAVAMTANAALVEGRMAEAEELARQSLEAEGGAGGDRLWLARNVLVFATAAAARLEEADAMLDEMEGLAHPGFPMPRAVALFDRALLASFAKDRAAGQRAARQLLDLATACQSATLRAMGLVSIGRTFDDDDDPAPAMAALDEAVALAVSGRCNLVANQAQRTLLEIQSRGGNRRGSLAALKRLLEAFQRSGDVSQQVQTLVSALDPLVQADALDLAAVLCAGLARTPLGTAVQCRRARDAAQSRLSPEDFVACTDRGTEMAPGALVRWATAHLDPLVSVE